MKADPATRDPELDRDLRALFAGVAQPVAPASLATTVEELPERGRAGRGGGLRRRADELFGRPVSVALAAGTIVLAVATAALVLNLRGGQSATSGPGPTSASTTAPAATPSPVVASLSPSALTLSKEAAVAAAEKFIGRPLGAVDVSDPKAWPGGQYIEIMEQGGGADVWVDAATGNVVFMMLSAPLTTAVDLTPEQAQSAASAFLTAHNVPFDGLTATVALKDHGCCKEYTVTWQRYANGASVPDMREVGVDPATGQVFSFMDRRVAYAPVPSPALSRDQAIAKAIAASGLSSPTVGDVQLLVDSSPIWPGRLVWSVQLSQLVPVDSGSGLGEYVSAYWVYVDAVTGETKIAGQG
jgi:hypothetical protein